MLLVSCSTTLNFSGESTNWKGSYQSTINTKTSSEQGTYEFRFKGKKMKNNTVDELLIDNNGKNTKITEISLQKGTIKVPVTCSGCAISSKNNSIKITIKWDNTEETFNLK
ncbi:hypothetical protein LMZ02_06630 [Paenibacillus macerans]|nr:hypothetical protein [Paenibacillus macerans]MBS5911048.1 hypothetical protein [Paenibacillus macerans]MEC0331676.1 hypothetical protein [Paenibacillus macerans]UMV49038.1 hypothetical protein LMZ02_06630 [Paenibacillus macerans]GBK65678.1 hypothetical protein PbDSM24746_56820 [Paenibacillus macerans]GBK71905.1 hypothetical protein PbJCM17693_56130 [Paenibacillus macerans]